MADLQDYKTFKDSVRNIKILLNKPASESSVTKVGKFVSLTVEGGTRRIIWNLLANNALAVVNLPDGITRMRPTSIYYDAISATRDIVPSTTLDRYRSYTSNIRREWFTSYCVTLNMDRIRENDEKDGEIKLYLGNEAVVRRSDIFNATLVAAMNGKFTKTAAAMDRVVGDTTPLKKNLILRIGGEETNSKVQKDNSREFRHTISSMPMYDMRYDEIVNYTDFNARNT